MFGPLRKMLGMGQKKTQEGGLVERCKNCGNKELDYMLSAQGVVMSQICRRCNTRQWIDSSKVEQPTGDIDI